MTLLGHAPTDLIGTRPLDGVHPDDAEGYARLLDDLIEGRVEHAVTCQRYRHASGSWVWLEISFTLTHDPATGKSDGYVASLRDIGVRMAIEESLRFSEARYRTLADSLPQLVWITSVETGEATYVNRRFETYYGPIGPSRAARLARNHPDDAGRMAALWHEARERDSVYEAEGRLCRHDGVYRWHKIIVQPIHQDGEIVGLLGSALDIDDIVAARRKVEETSDLLLLAQQSANAGTWHFDLDTGRICLSPDAARLYGIQTSVEHILSAQDWLCLVERQDGEAALAAAEQAAASGKTFSIEFRVPLADGAVRWISSTGRGQADASSRIRQMHGLNIDVTERKAAETALLTAKMEAEAARSEAESASAAKSEFLAAMSHEIRTPLNGVIGYADLLVDEMSHDSRVRQHAERIRSAGSALLTVVNDILDFSKIEAGQIEIVPRPFAPGALVDNAISIVRGLAEAKGLALDVSLDDAVPGWLLGDEDRLRQVILNLLNNAIKFTARGRIDLLVQATRTDHGAVTLRCVVQDTGPGIPLDKRDRLFRRFSQVDGSISRDFGGTGLGLAICKALVEGMGGTIGIDSEAGRGSRFWFALDLPISAEPSSAGTTTPELRHRRGRRLLLAEDVPLNQELARAILERAGHRVDVVGDGAAAVAAVQAQTYDLVLMDVQMPGVDGLTATRRIRELGAAGRVPILALTANVLPQQIETFREAGMDDHVGKPFRQDVLLSAIDRWTRRENGAASPARIDREAFDEMKALIGHERMRGMLVALADELSRRFGPSGTAQSREAAAADAHALIPAASMIGFSALAELCRELEAACRSGADYRPLVEALRARASETIAEIERQSA